MVLNPVITLPVEYFDEAGKIIYPDSDGERMADNTKQFEWIATIKGNLDSVFAHQTDVFVAGDLLWYPIEGNPLLKVAPDVMVAFGRPKGHRGSYKQWEEDNIAPQVVFEILSPGNTSREMLRKWRFYNRYGVEEYYVYDPDSNEFYVWTRAHEGLVEQIIELEWYSPSLQVTFRLESHTLKIFDNQGKAFLTFVEQAQAKEEALQQLEDERKAKEDERKAKEDAIFEENKAIAEKEALIAEMAQLKDLLKKAGLNPMD
ncbi:MAG: Uma2 family endonuclease [Microscillaceae bacterium]|nr:Uma2 family endonuclease [Microscillaceae bacterium]